MLLAREERSCYRIGDDADFRSANATLHFAPPSPDGSRFDLGWVSRARIRVGFGEISDIFEKFL